MVKNFQYQKLYMTQVKKGEKKTMNKKFNINDYPGKYVMHCKTEEEAKDFCRVLHEAGRTWCTGRSYIDRTNFKYDKGGTCYNFNIGAYAEKFYYTKPNEDYTILEWSDFMNKEFTKADLRTGDMVLLRSGDVKLYIKEARMFVGSRQMGDWDYDTGFTNGLKRSSSSTYDIVSVRRPDKVSDISFDAFDKNLGRLVYERDETVEMTLEEVCKALGKNVKIVKE